MKYQDQVQELQCLTGSSQTVFFLGVSTNTPPAYHQASAVGEKRHSRGRRTPVTFESLECTGLPQISGEEEEEQPGSHRSEAGDQEEKGWRRGAKRVRGRREIKTARTGKAVGSTETMKRELIEAGVRKEE